MSTRFIVVHRFGSNNPFLGRDGVWVPNRTQAHVFDVRDNAESARKSQVLAYFRGKEDHLVVDEWYHPEVEAALSKCFVGDYSAMDELERYRTFAGFASLRYFAQRVAGDTFPTILNHWARASVPVT